MSSGRRDEAIVAYHHAITLDADHAQAHSNLGVAFKELDRMDQAIAAYRTAIDLKPNYA